MNRPASKQEFIQFVKDNVKFKSLKYHYLFKKYNAKTNYEKKRLKELFDSTENELVKNGVDKL